MNSHFIFESNGEIRASIRLTLESGPYSVLKQDFVPMLSLFFARFVCTKLSPFVMQSLCYIGPTSPPPPRPFFLFFFGLICRPMIRVMKARSPPKRSDAQCVWDDYSSQSKGIWPDFSFPSCDLSTLRPQHLFLRTVTQLRLKTEPEPVLSWQIA